MNEVLPYAGFWRRLGAQAVDGLIFVPVVLVLAKIANGAGLAHGDSAASTVDVSDLLIRYVLPFAVIMPLWWLYSATPGKQLFHCRIVDANTGGKPSLGQFALRYLGYLASALPVGIGFLWILWDPNKQGLHDKISRTVVVYAPEDDSSKSLEELAREGQ